MASSMSGAQSGLGPLGSRSPLALLSSIAAPVESVATVSPDALLLQDAKNKNVKTIAIP